MVEAIFESLGIKDLFNSNDGNKEILDLKKEVAEVYVNKLKQQDKTQIANLIVEDGDALKNYLVSEGLGDKIMDNVKGKLFQGIDPIFFDKIQNIKDKIDNANTKDELNNLKTEIINYNDSDHSESNNSNQNSNNSHSNNGSVENYNDSSPRQKVCNSIDNILEIDKNNPIKYGWGSRNINNGLDCSGLIIYAMQQAGLKSLGGDSRSIFQNLKTQKLEMDNDKIKTNVSNIKKGDMIFWNSTNSNYKRSSGAIPKIEKDGQDYRIHHIAFVDSIDPNTGEIKIIESNGANGVQETVINPNSEKDKKHQSDLYVAHVDYTKQESNNETMSV